MLNSHRHKGVFTLIDWGQKESEVYKSCFSFFFLITLPFWELYNRNHGVGFTFIKYDRFLSTWPNIWKTSNERNTGLFCIIDFEISFILPCSHYFGALWQWCDMFTFVFKECCSFTFWRPGGKTTTTKNVWGPILHGTLCWPKFIQVDLASRTFMSSQ